MHCVKKKYLEKNEYQAIHSIGLWHCQGTLEDPFTLLFVLWIKIWLHIPTQKIVMFISFFFFFFFWKIKIAFKNLVFNLSFSMMSGRSFSVMNITCQMVSMFLDSTHLHDKHGNCFLYLCPQKFFHFISRQSLTEPESSHFHLCWNVQLTSSLWRVW